MSRTRDIAKILGLTEAENTSSISLGAGGGGGGATAYDSVGVFPTSGNTAGDLAFATSTKTIHNWDGSAWDKIYSGTNEVPTWDSALPATIVLANNGASSIIRFKAATDIEGFPINYSYQTVPAYPSQLDSAFGEDSGSGGTGILDSSDHPTDPRITLKPSVTASDAGTFTLRVKADDGSHVITSSSTCSLSFFEGDYFYIANATYTASKDTISATADTYQGSSVSLATVGGVQGHIGGVAMDATGGDVNNSMLWDLTNTGGFNAQTDLIVISFYLASAPSSPCLGIGIQDNTANHGMMIAGYNGSIGIVKSTGSFFAMPAFPTGGTWVIMAAGGGNSILDPSATASSSGLRFWQANTSGGSTLGTEYSAAISGGVGWSPQDMAQPGIIALNGGDAGAYTSGSTRSSLAWNIRSVQIYYDQTTSGKSIESIVGDHQKLVFG